MSYSQSSPYYLTTVFNNEFLDVMVDRVIPMDPADIYWVITQTYQMRPDLLAYDLYGDGKLWWIFAQRNPNRLKDPIFDFVAGTGIYIPQLPALRQALGI